MRKRNPAGEEAERFARVWRRVVKDPERSPIQCAADLPETEGEDGLGPRGTGRRTGGRTGDGGVLALAALAAVFIIHSQSLSNLFTTSGPDSSRLCM